MSTYSCKHAMEEEMPGPCSWCESNLLANLRALTNERDRARLALKDLFLMMDQAILVRNTDSDGSPDWAMKMLDVVTRLKDAHAAIKYEAPLGSKSE